ncbi:hypothetical protein JL720_16005 [Aureococcus anophagefferens]|nr:hypothetical protein JL720_16005 [Aureococcus anophagefferens]
MAFVARSFNAWAAANPVSAACFFGGGKNVGVDACVQLATAGGDVRQMDLRRSACFLAFGTLWIGGAQYYIFNKLIPRLVPAINAPNPTFATALKAGASTMIFGPVQTLNFWLMPTHLRVPTVVTAAIVWASLLDEPRRPVQAGRG